MATFTDLGGPEDVSEYTATIDWGDSNHTTSPGTIVANLDGSFSVLGSNTYAEAGSYTISVAIGHGGLTTTVEDAISVSPPPNTPPTANDLSITTAEDASISGQVTGADADGDPFAFALSPPVFRASRLPCPWHFHL